MLYTAKAIALLMIVGAHMSFGEQFVEERFRISVCQIGVIIFFLCSGFFYKREDRDTGLFWKKKLKTVLIPWALMATGTFLLSLVLSRNLADLPLRYLKWILGIGTHYWYMSVMIVCFFVFKALTLPKNQKIRDFLLIGCMLISLISVLLSILSVIGYNSVWNQYTNVFNWIGFFALGVMLRDKNWLDKILSLKVAIPAFLILIAFLVLSTLEDGPIEAYINPYSLPIEVFGSICVLETAWLLRQCKVIIDLGKKSFFVYLIHIQIAGLINTRLPDNTVFFILRPFLAVGVCYIIAKILEWVIKKTRLYEKIGVCVALR